MFMTADSTMPISELVIRTPESKIDDIKDKLEDVLGDLATRHYTYIDLINSNDLQRIVTRFEGRTYNPDLVKKGVDTSGNERRIVTVDHLTNFFKGHKITQPGSRANTLVRAFAGTNGFTQCKDPDTSTPAICADEMFKLLELLEADQNRNNYKIGTVTVDYFKAYCEELFLPRTNIVDSK